MDTKSVPLSRTLARILYTIAAEGADEEAGPESESDATWAAQLRGGGDLAGRIEDVLTGSDAAEMNEIDPEELQQVRASSGVIVTRDADGGITAEAFASEADLTAAWSALMADLEPGEPGAPTVVSSESEEGPT